MVSNAGDHSAPPTPCQRRFSFLRTSFSSIGVTGSSTGDYATVVYREVPAVSIDVRLRFTRVPGRSYNMERAPAVTGPGSTINTQTAPLGGLIEYVDTNASWAPPSTAQSGSERVVGAADFFRMEENRLGV